MESRLPEWKALQSAARQARDNAWAPYSKFSVGTAVLTQPGTIVVGCNVENASYGLTICAERVAMCAAVAMGHRQIRAICVSLKGIPVPCGACRQFLSEFNPEMLVLLDNLDASVDAKPELLVLSELLPRAFRLTQD